MSTSVSKKRKNTKVVPPKKAKDPARFLNRDNETWYEQRLNVPFIVEKTIAQSIDDSFDIVSHFQDLGWESVLYLNTPYYPKLVKEFFANIVSKDEVNLRNIVSYVKNVHINLTEWMILLGAHFALVFMLIQIIRKRMLLSV